MTQRSRHRHAGPPQTSKPARTSRSGTHLTLHHHTATHPPRNTGARGGLPHHPETYQGQLKGILNNASIFGVDLTATPLADKIESYFVAELAGPGAVRKTLHDALA